MREKWRVGRDSGKVSAMSDTGLSTSPAPGAGSMRARRLMWRVIRWLFAVPTALLVIVVALNAVDARLRPETLAVMQAPPNTLADADNLYVLLAGLDAPLGIAVLVQGQRNLREFSEALQDLPPGQSPPAEVGRTPHGSRLEVAQAPGAPNMRVGSLWNEVRSAGRLAEPMSESAIEFLRRYRALFAASGYHETLPPHLAMPYYFVPAPVRRLFLEDVARRVQEGTAGEAQDALRELAADMALWHRMLRGEGLLVSKMLALAYLHVDLLLLGDIVTDQRVPDALLAGNAQLFELSDAEVWRIGAVFASEFRVQRTVIATLDGNSEQFLYDAGGSPSWDERLKGRIGRWFYLPNDTLNLAAAVMAQTQRLADGDPASLMQRSAELETQRKADGPTSLPGVLRNPIGKILIDIAAPSYSTYAVRSYDIAALQRAVRLAYEIRLRKIAASDIAQFMVEHPLWSQHPIGPTALRWDARTLRLSVPRMENPTGSSDRRYDLSVLPGGAMR
jgi:hypothetical protein